MTTTTVVAAAEESIADDPLPPPRGRVCFSFAAYAKAVVAHLRASGVPIAPGLSDAEFSAVESTYGFDFPPDLRSILREGLPIGPGFPNWRSASPQQIHLRIGLPAAGLLHEASAGEFWPRGWGPRPRDSEVSSVARASLRRAPPLVPIYRHFYVPAAASLAGNPVFYVRGGDVRRAGLDLSDFFRREHPPGWVSGAPSPSWAATSARRVEVWTELAEWGAWRERERSCSPWEVRVERQLEEARRRLREGGWSEEEVAEMVADGVDRAWASSPAVLKDREGVMRQLRLFSLALLQGGWSADDVVESMGWARAAEGASTDVARGPRTKQPPKRG